MSNTKPKIDKIIDEDIHKENMLNHDIYNN